MKTTAATVASCCLLAASCSVETAPGPPPPPGVPVGTLTLDWTINGTKDPDQCSQGAAMAVDVTVHTVDGGFVGEFQEACDAFATSIDLAEGSYVADAVLVDARGTERTTAVPIQAFTIRGDDDLDIPIDFPARAFR